MIQEFMNRLKINLTKIDILYKYDVYEKYKKCKLKIYFFIYIFQIYFYFVFFI